MKESPMAEDTQTENNHPHTVLVVEDSKPDQVLVMNQIHALWPECNIVPVKSIHEAHEACTKHEFDMVMLDLNLPDGSGADSVQSFREFEKNVPIIVITGSLTDSKLQEALDFGANTVISKTQMMVEDFSKVLEDTNT